MTKVLILSNYMDAHARIVLSRLKREYKYRLPHQFSMTN